MDYIIFFSFALIIASHFLDEYQTGVAPGICQLYLCASAIQKFFLQTELTISQKAKFSAALFSQKCNVTRERQKAFEFRETCIIHHSISDKQYKRPYNISVEMYTTTRKENGKICSRIPSLLTLQNRILHLSP